MTTEEKKLNTRYFKLLKEYEKANSRAKHLKLEMQDIRRRITPTETIIDNDRPDLQSMK